MAVLPWDAWIHLEGEADQRWETHIYSGVNREHPMGQRSKANRRSDATRRHHTAFSTLVLRIREGAQFSETYDWREGPVHGLHSPYFILEAAVAEMGAAHRTGGKTASLA